MQPDVIQIMKYSLRFCTNSFMIKHFITMATFVRGGKPHNLHALYSNKLYQENNVQGRIVVKSPDMDVLVLLVHYCPKD